MIRLIVSSYKNCNMILKSNRILSHCKPYKLRSQHCFHSSASNQAIFHIQDEQDFKEKVIKSDIPVVVDFHAHWCGPCKILGPRLENVIGGKDDKIHLAKIDIDKVSDLALEYGVSAVPYVLAFKEGKVIDKFVGLQEETRIDAFVKKLF